MNLEEEFLEKYWRLIPNNIDTVEIRIPDLKRKILELNPSRPLVSLDRIYMAEADAYVNLTRETNPSNGLVKLAPRNGTPPLKDQVKQLKNYNQWNIFDIGVFDGDTILSVCDLIESEGIEIGEIYLGVASTKGYQKLTEKRKLKVVNIFDFFEWVELRDLFGIDGRSVYSEKERSFIPYWENLPGWASIDGDNEVLGRELCLKTNRKLKQILREDNLNLKNLGTIVNYGGK